MNKKLAVTLAGFAAVGVTVLCTASSCDKVTEPYQDAPISTHDGSAAKVLEFPDGFSNLAAKCDGPNMVYSGYHGDDNRISIAVAPNDPRCVAAEHAGSEVPQK